jgi:hypothetical protein
MIDNPDQVERLLGRLREALPLPALATPRLIATLREQPATARVMPRCTVTRVGYAGDKGGVVCHLAFAEGGGPGVAVVSITHLTFDRGLAVAAAIAAY